MDRRIAETTMGKLTDEQYARLYGLAFAATEKLVVELASTPALDMPDRGVRPGDVDDEPQHRMNALRRVEAGQLAGALLAEVTAEFTAREAATSVWLGASLADLGSASGSTRQAARKRWPDLGLIYRTRRWLSGYHHDIFHIVDLLLAAFATSREPRLVGALSQLREARDELVADFASGSSVCPVPTSESPTDGSPVTSIRWQRLGDLVDQRVRAVVDAVRPTGDEATFAINAAIGLLAHYDSVLDQPSQQSP